MKYKLKYIRTILDFKINENWKTLAEDEILPYTLEILQLLHPKKYKHKNCEYLYYPCSLKELQNNLLLPIEEVIALQQKFKKELNL